MSELRERFEDEDGQFASLERAIYAARNYVVPSDDLRPRTLEGAREQSRQLGKVHRLGFVAAASLLVWSSCVLLVGSANAFRESMVAPFGDEMQHIAVELSTKQNDTLEWGWVEAFSHYRGLQANHLRATPSNSRYEQPNFR